MIKKISINLSKHLANFYYKLAFYFIFYDFKFINKRIVNKLQNKKIIFYPQVPVSEAFVINKICNLLGYSKINDLNGGYYLAVNWQAGTFREKDDFLKLLSNISEVVNLKCRDVSKKKVEAIMKEIFGYSLLINPETFSGECVKKSDLNFKHDGKIIRCPIKNIEEHFVYQRLVDNRVNDYLIQDIRIPVFKGEMPFAYLKYRPVSDRFSNTNTRVKIAKLENIISKEEKEKITLFCMKIGLDYGEVDIVRDANDKKLYILDANNIPFGPPNHISFLGYMSALNKMADCFERTFIRYKF